MTVPCGHFHRVQRAGNPICHWGTGRSGYLGMGASRVPTFRRSLELHKYIWGSASTESRSVHLSAAISSGDFQPAPNPSFKEDKYRCDHTRGPDLSLKYTAQMRQYSSSHNTHGPDNLPTSLSPKNNHCGYFSFPGQLQMPSAPPDPVGLLLVAPKAHLRGLQEIRFS